MQLALQVEIQTLESPHIDPETGLKAETGKVINLPWRLHRFTGLAKSRTFPYRSFTGPTRHNANLTLTFRIFFYLTMHGSSVISPTQHDRPSNIRTAAVFDENSRH